MTKLNCCVKNSFLLILGLCLFTACKINYSLNGAAIPPEAETVSVKYFDNVSSLAPPMLSQQFTEALRDKISGQTRLGLVTSGGDLSFEGKVTGYKTAPIALQSSDQASLNRLTITVSVSYVCAFDQSKNFDQSFSRFYDYDSSESLADVEEGLITLINEQLVQDIFNKALNNW